MIKALKKEVENAFDEIIEKYTLRVKQIDDYSVYLVGASYAIKVILNRDGLSDYYYDLRIDNKKIYDFFSYLCDKRSDKLIFIKNNEYANKPLIEKVRLTLPFMARNIKNAGSDILAGDKTWIKQYHRSTVEIPAEIYAQLTHD